VGRERIRRTIVGVVCALALGAAASARGDMPVLWQIGEADGKTSDLALGPTGYGKFTDDGFFVVGRSNAREAWPYAHPGPGDAWAGNRGHVFTVLFSLQAIPAPETAGATTVGLRLLLSDAHASDPPRVEAALNDAVQSAQTERGAGDATIMEGRPGRASELVFAYPLGALRAGLNRIDVRTVSGSWFLYDAVQFLAPEGVRLGEVAPVFFSIQRVEDTPLLRRRDGRPTQLVRAQVLAAADAPVSVTFVVTIEGWGGRESIEQTTTVRPGRQMLLLDAPRPSGWPLHTHVAMTIADGPASSATTTLQPHRQWTVHLAPHSHVDIGYTEVQPKVLALQKKSIVEAMDFAEQHPELTGDAKFCWNVEVLWAVKDFLREADEAQRARFFQHVREGALGLDALLANELTGLCAPEELARLVAYAGQLQREAGVTIDSAMITDVPGYSWGTAAVLAAAGVKYFDIGPNADARIGTSRTAWHDRPFYWVAPDGKGRVLTWLAPYGYYRMFNLLQGDGPQAMVKYLSELDRNPNYPYDLVHLRMCTGDNGTPPFELAAFVRDWNEQYESPRLIIGRTRDAFVALEAKWRDRIPSYTGEYAPYWEDGAASSADETARNRRAAKTLEAAEKAWSLAAAAGHAAIPATEIDRAWDNAILYDEHTWGAHNSISEPDAPFVREQWAIKQAFALDAERQSDALLDGGLKALAGRIATGEGRTIVVFNPSSWARTDLVRVPVEANEAGAVVDADGRAVAHRRAEDGGALTFIARDAPALGYRTYRLAPADAPSPENLRPRAEANNIVLTVDGQTPALSQLVARAGDTERPLASAGFNQYLYCRNGDPNNVASAERVLVKAATPESPDGAALVVWSQQAPGCQALTQRVEVHGELPWIDIANTLERGDVREPEGIYFDFPLDGLARPTIRYETAWAPVQLESDLLAGSCKNYFCAQHFVEIAGEGQTVVLAPIDAPLIEIGEIHRNTRTHQLPPVERLKLEPARVLSFVMNNYWFTNYRASQPGTTTFRYRVYAYEGNDPAKTARCGLEAREPLRATVVGPNAAGTLPAAAHSFLQVEPENVVVTAIAPAAGGGTLLRLHEVAGRGANVRLALAKPGLGDRARKADRVDLFERPMGELDLRDGVLSLEIGPREIVTVRVQ